MNQSGKGQGQLVGSLQHGDEPWLPYIKFLD